MSKVQSMVQSASEYKNLSLKKLRVKRGRSVNRQEKRGSSIETRIMRDKLLQSFAAKEYRKEMDQFQKTVTEAASRGIHDIPMPDFLVTLRDNLRLAEGNLQSARVSKAAMDRFPPLI